MKGGTYQLIVTEIRNGCKDTVTVTLDLFDLMVLTPNIVKLSGLKSKQAILLKWEHKNESVVNYYTVEKSFDGVNFAVIGNLTGTGVSSDSYYFSDNQPGKGNILYRIKSVDNNGSVYYSNTINFSQHSNSQWQFSVINNYSKGNLSLLCNADNDASGSIFLYSLNGQFLQKTPVNLTKGTSVINVPIKTHVNNEIIIVALQVNNEIVFSGNGA